MRINLYGRKIEATLSEERWKVFHLGSEGKKRMAIDIVIPSEITEAKLLGYLTDMFHEWARPGNDRVYEIKH